MNLELAKAIAEILERDCRVNPVDLASTVGASEGEVTATIEEMVKRGIIVRYGAKIDWQRLDDTAKVFATIAVQVSPERNHGFDNIAAQIARFSEVHSLYLLSGSHDFDVVIEGTSMRDIALFVAERLSPLPGVRSTNTHFVLRTYKRDGDILIGKPADRRLGVTP